MVLKRLTLEDTHLICLTETAEALNKQIESGVGFCTERRRWICPQ